MLTMDSDYESTMKYLPPLTKFVLTIIQCFVKQSVYHLCFNSGLDNSRKTFFLIAGEPDLAITIVSYFLDC